MIRVRRPGKSAAVALVAVQAALVTLVVALGEAGRHVAPFSESSLPVDAFGAVTSMAFAVVGLVIVVRRPGTVIGWLFVLSNLGWDLSNAATAWVEFGLRVAPLPAVPIVAWFATWPGPLSLAVYVLLILLFPDGRAASARWGRLARIAIAWGVVHATLSAIASGPIEALQLEGLDVANPFALPNPAGAIAASLAYGLLELLSVGLITIAAFSLVVRLRRANGVEREQLKWLASAVAVTAVMNILNVPIMIAFTSLADAPPWARAANAILTSGGFLIPIAAAIAILRYRLYDIDRIISRTLTYGFVTALLAAAYLGAFLAIQTALAPLTERTGPLAVATSTLVVFALFAPLRSRMRAIVDRRFDRSRYDAEQTIEAFVARVRDEVDVERVSRELAGTLERTMHPVSAGVWLRETVRSA
ncbi:MAG TPA: hypothetical protein VFS32_12910 [Candidatus Limnocylindrales bacterium]|nr:hypothetical protein [Candidatus Limnocylindrales bacterium]